MTEYSHNDAAMFAEHSEYFCLVIYLV